MKATNSLTSHHGESRARRADKMGRDSIYKDMPPRTIKEFKRFTKKKMRMMLKNLNIDKI